ETDGHRCGDVRDDEYGSSTRRRRVRHGLSGRAVHARGEGVADRGGHEPDSAHGHCAVAARIGGTAMTVSGATGAAAEPAAAPDPARVTLLTRTACHLCEPVRTLVAQVCSDGGYSWREVNVDTDADLRSEYGDQ